MNFRARVSFPRIIARIRTFNFADILGLLSSVGSSTIEAEGRVDPSGRVRPVGTCTVEITPLLTRIGLLVTSGLSSVVISAVRYVGMHTATVCTSVTTFAGQMFRGGLLSISSGGSTTMLASVNRVCQLNLTTAGITTMDSRVTSAFTFADGVTPVSLVVGGNMNLIR